MVSCLQYLKGYAYMRHACESHRVAASSGKRRRTRPRSDKIETLLEGMRSSYLKNTFTDTPSSPSHCWTHRRRSYTVHLDAHRHSRHDLPSAHRATEPSYIFLHGFAPWANEDMVWTTRETRAHGSHYQTSVELLLWAYVTQMLRYHEIVQV